MKTKTQFMNRILSLVLSIMMVVSMLPASTLSVFAADTTYPYAVADTEAGTVTIDGTLGGKTTATEEDINALLEAIKGYVDSGITTIIVTGGNPAVIEVSGIVMPAVSEAIYRLSGNGNYDENNPYKGKIDLVLPDVTEIVAMEFYAAFALNSITLPKVTTVGDGAFTGCYYLKKMTFGSVVTSINQSNSYVFYEVGKEVDGGSCDLVLNCGQLQTEDTYKPDLENNVWFKPSWGGNVTWKSITLTHTEGTAATCTAPAVCSVCGENYGEVDADAHNYGDWVSNGNGTHTRTCANDSTYTENGDCSGGTATCKEQAVCDICKTAYGALGGHTAEPTYAPNAEDSTKHDVTYSCCGATVTEAHTLDVTTGKCGACGADMTAIATVTDGTNTYYAADAATLNQAATAILETGSRTFTVELPADAEAEMITAIRRAICDTEGVADGSIHLTLKGVTTIPGTTNWDGVAFGPRNAQWDENNVEIVSHEEVTQLASVNLPDVTEIGAQAFLDCSNLTSITAPKVQSIGDWGLQGTAITSVDMPLLKEAGYSAFCRTALTEVSLPSLETAGVIVFGHCEQLRTVDLPKLQNLSQQLFTRCTSLVSVSAPAATSMGNNVFKGCSELVSITLPGVTELTYDAFAECTKLENITLGSVITKVNVNLFAGEALSSGITLTLNCGQKNAETLPAAAGENVEWAGFTWKEVKFAHSYVNSKCTVCGEDCTHTGGTATCTTLAVCDICKTAYGELGGHTYNTAGSCTVCGAACPHSNFDPATGNCKDCEISLAIAKIKTGETTIYYQTAYELSTAIENNSADQAITLLANFEVIRDLCFYAGEAKNTLDLNGHTLTGSSRIDVEYGELTITGTGSINIFMTADNKGAKIVVGSGVTLNNSLRSVYGGVLDLTNATIPEAGLNVILYSDDSDPTTYNVSDVLLLPADYYFFVDGKAVYTYSGETEGTVLKHTDHSYTYTDNGDGTHKATCTACGKVEVDNEPHTIENHVCTACGAMEIVVSFNAGDFEWKTGDKLYFCRVSGDNEWEEYAFTATVAGDGTVTWTPDKTLYWDGTGEHKLVVVYPGDTPWAWDRFYVGDDQTTTEKLHEFDLMNAMWSGNPTTDPITLNLKHRLAKVTVNYEIAEGVTVSKAEVYTLTQYLLFDIHTLERKNIAWEEGHDLWINSYHNGNQFTAFVSPDAYAADGNFIKITLSDGSVREVKMNKAVTFEEGKEYTYKLIITADGAYLTCEDECSFEYTDNGNGTHKKVCSECGYVAASENHILTYTVDGNTITVSCSANCGYTGTATISATGKTYDGTAVEVIVSKTGSLENTDIPVTLTKDGEAFAGEPVNAGAYTASITLGDKTVSVDFTIDKAAAIITAAPTPDTLTYIGESQYLISAGEAVGGTMVYSLTENGEYTTSIPQGTNAGDYTVWYYVQGDANHKDSAKDYVSVTIAKATPTAEDFIFTAPTDLIYDGTAKPATITVKDGIVGMGEVNIIYFRDAGMWIDNEREPIYPGRYKVGIWIKEGDNYNAVYSNERIWLGDEFEIKYLTTDAKADISGTIGSNGWYTSDVTLTAPEGYQISKTKYNDGFVSELTISAEKNETITYYLKDANGDVAEKTVDLKIDKTAPSAQYQIGTNGWKQFINTITFGLFCKDYKTVDIEYTDDLSGVAEKQYYISSEEITNTSRIAWLDYTDTLSLNATGKYFIYMRVVDNAGNEVILNTEGIVIYEDSIQVTESVSATYNAGTDKAVTVKLNGNTVNAIQNGNAVLTAGTDYTVSADGTITLKASYLDALKAGEYTFTVSYNPQGVETDKVNMTTAFTVKVEKADGKVSNLNISSKTYDGTAVTAPTFDKLGDGAATIEYKVKGADDSTYTTTAPKDAGDYIVRVTVAEGTNHKAASATAEFTIDKAAITGISVKQDGKLTYNGKAQTPTVSTSATTVDGSKVTFTYSTESEGPYSTEIPSFTNAGWTHHVYYRATAENHNASYGSFLVEIEKAIVTEPTIASKPYNGSAQTADISDTDFYTVEKNNGGTEKGSYDVVLKLKDSANYKWSTTNNAEVTLQFVISAAQNTWDTNPSISGWTYGEAAKTPVGTAKYGAAKVVYTGKANDGTDYNSETAPTKAGNYTATFTVTGTEDYSGLSEQVNFTIAKKAVTVTANDASKTYGESDPALTYTHTELVGSDALVITVARTSGENANTYTITASQAEGANPNYEITFKTGTFTIHKATLTVTVEDKTATYGDPVPTYTVKYEGFKSGDDKDDLGGALAFECGYAQFSDKGEYTIKASGYTSGNYTISYVDGKLTVNAKPITVTIQNATSVYGDTLAELKATDNGIVNGDSNVYSLATTATGTSNVGKYTITGAALDSNYDVTFVNGEYEITKREITITVDAKNTVVNTTLPTYTYKVEGLVGVDTLVTEPTLTCNANIALIGEYDITAFGADAGGNYSIKYVPAKLTVLTDNAVDVAAGYTDELKDYDPATVTSEDKAELEEMLSEINTILADETTTDNGKKALEEVKEQVEKLIKEITDAAEATDTENTEKVENVTPENVIPENKTDLEGAKADLEKALEDNGGNYTEDEKKAIEEEIKRIDDALEVIGNVEAVEKVISMLPAVDTVEPDDEEAIKAITDAQTAYNALSDYEKSLVDEATKVTLDKLAAALVAYDIVEGDGSSWTEDSDHNITFVVNGLFGKFVGIKVDGKDVDKANYEVKAGSTIITLKVSYLDTLAVGEHTITVVYTDGSTDGAFNVHAKANSPATGDDFNIALYSSLMTVSVTALVVLLLASKKRKQVK